MKVPAVMTRSRRTVGGVEGRGVVAGCRVIVARFYGIGVVFLWRLPLIRARRLHSFYSGKPK